MPERKRRPRDPNQLAYQIVQEATGQAEEPAERLDTRNPANPAAALNSQSSVRPRAGTRGLRPCCQPAVGPSPRLR
jgi:hypothetical protein